MSVRVRLTRVGSKKNPIWRVVVADQRSPRDGRFIEQIGHYNPRTEPSTIVIDRERLDHWLELGAQPSNTVRKLMRAKPPEAGAVAAEEPETEEPEAEESEAEEPAPEGASSEPAGGSEPAAEPVDGGAAGETEPAEREADAEPAEAG
jgi:small subunit ribosomal protein S16